MRQNSSKNDKKQALKELPKGYATRSVIAGNLDPREHRTLTNQFSFENLNMGTFKDISVYMGRNKRSLNFLVGGDAEKSPEKQEQTSAKKRAVTLEEMEADVSHIPDDFTWDDSKEEEFRRKKKHAAYLFTRESQVQKYNACGLDPYLESNLKNDKVHTKRVGYLSRYLFLTRFRRNSSLSSWTVNS